MQNSKKSDRPYSTSDPTRFKLTTINNSMQAFDATNYPIAMPIIAMRALTIACTKCTEALELNIGITYSLFKRRIKFMTHSTNESDAITTELTEFVNSHANTGILIKIGSNAKKEQNLIKRWNAALRKLFNSSAIDYQTLNKWEIPPDNSIDWFSKCSTTANSLNDTSAEADKAKTEEYFKSMEETVKFLEKESKNQSTNKGDDAKTALTELVVKTAAMIGEARTFFANTSNFNTIEAMYNKLGELTAKAKLGDLNTLLKDNQSVEEDFKNILPENIQEDYGDGKTFGSKEGQEYVKVWRASLKNAKDNFTEKFKQYKDRIKNINQKRDKKIKKQVDLAESTRNVLRDKQKQIRGLKTITEQNKQSIADISPTLLGGLNGFCTQCDELLVECGRLNNTKRAAFRACYLPANVIGRRDSARKNLYELYSHFVTILAELKSGKTPSYSPSNLKTTSDNVTTQVNEFSKAVNSIKGKDIKLSNTPTSDAHQQSKLEKKVKHLQQIHAGLTSSIKALLYSTTFGAKLLQILKSLLPVAIFMLISKMRNSSSDASGLS